MELAESNPVNGAASDLTWFTYILSALVCEAVGRPSARCDFLSHCFPRADRLRSEYFSTTQLLLFAFRRLPFGFIVALHFAEPSSFSETPL